MAKTNAKCPNCNSDHLKLIGLSVKLGYLSFYIQDMNGNPLECRIFENFDYFKPILAKLEYDNNLEVLGIPVFTPNSKKVSFVRVFDIIEGKLNDS